MYEFKIKTGLLLGSSINSQPVVGITNSSDFGNLAYEDSSALATVEAIKNYIASHQGPGSVAYGDVSEIPFVNSSSDGFSYTENFTYEVSGNDSVISLSAGNHSTKMKFVPAYKSGIFLDDTSILDFNIAETVLHNSQNSSNLVLNNVSAKLETKTSNTDKFSYLSLSQTGNVYLYNQQDISVGGQIMLEIDTNQKIESKVWDFETNHNQNISISNNTGIDLKSTMDSDIHEISLNPGEKKGIVISDSSLIGMQYLLSTYASDSESWIPHKKYVDTKVSSMDPSGNYLLLTGGTIDGSLVINKGLSVSGDVIIDGSLYIRDVENVDISTAFIHLNTGEHNTPPPSMQSGIIVNRGTLNPYVFLYDESNETFRIGTAPIQSGPSFDDSSTQSVATRQDSPNNMGIAYWNNSLNRFDTSTSLLINSSGGLEIHPKATGLGLQIYSPAGRSSVVSGNAINGSTARAWLFGRNGTASNDITLTAYLGKITLDTYTGDAYIKTVGQSNYQKIWHEGNDGSGSGLDSDTIDTLHAYQFIRSDVNDTATGTVTFSKSGTQIKSINPGKPSEGMFIEYGRLYLKDEYGNKNIRLAGYGDNYINSSSLSSKFGIGTSSPSEGVHMYRHGNLLIENNYQTPETIYFKHYFDSTHIASSQITYDYYGHDYGNSSGLHGMIYKSGRPAFGNHYFINDTGDPLLSILDNGNVGINKILSPSESLDVSGNIKNTGHIQTRDYVEVKDTTGQEGFKMQWNDTDKSIDFIIN